MKGKKIRWWRIDKYLFRYVMIEQIIVVGAFESGAIYWKASLLFHMVFLIYNMLLGIGFYLLSVWANKEE